MTKSSPILGVITMLPALNPTQTVSSGLPLPELAHELGVSPQSLRNWLGQAQIDAGEREG